MTSDERRQAHMLAAMFAMTGYIQSGMRPEHIAEASYALAEDLIAKYDQPTGIAAALKRRGQ